MSSPRYRPQCSTVGHILCRPRDIAAETPVVDHSVVLWVTSHVVPEILQQKLQKSPVQTTPVSLNSFNETNDVLHPPQRRLTSHTPLLSDMEPVDIISQWRDDWSSASVVNCDLVQDTTICPPGFSLPMKQWCTLNRFRTNQGHCGACRCSKLWLIATYVRVVPLRQCPT